MSCNVKTQFKGRIYWNIIHSSMFLFDNNPDEYNYEFVYNYIFLFIHTIPCKRCRYHAITYFNNFPPKLYYNISIYYNNNIINNRSLLYWSFLFHNHVNLKIGKDYFPFNQLIEKYKDYNEYMYLDHIINEESHCHN